MTKSQSRTAVNDKAGAAEGMPKLNSTVSYGGGSVEDLGGPTPQNEKPDDDSAKYKDNTGKQSKTRINDKGGAPESGGKVSSKADYGTHHDGTNSGRSNPGPEKLSRAASYEHVEAEAREHLEDLIEEQDLSEDFKEKAKVIFESALNQSLQLRTAELEEEFSSRFDEELGDIAEKVEAFLNYTSEQWLEENKLVVENGIRNQLAESFVQGLRSLFTDHYVTLPDEKYDIFESMVEKLDDMEEKLNEQIQVNVELSEAINEYQREAILSEVTWDMSRVSREKMAKLAESVEFGDEVTFKNKLAILKESFIDTQETVANGGVYLEESAEPTEDSISERYSPVMEAYSKALSATLR